MGNFQPNEAVAEHGFIYTEAEETQNFQPFRVKYGLEDLINYGPGVLAISFDKPIPDVIPPSSTDIMIFDINEGLPPTPRKCDTLYYKCLTAGQKALFKAVGV